MLHVLESLQLLTNTNNNTFIGDSPRNNEKNKQEYLRSEWFWVKFVELLDGVCLDQLEQLFLIHDDDPVLHVGLFPLDHLTFRRLDVRHLLEKTRVNSPSGRHGDWGRVNYHLWHLLDSST